MNILQVHKYYRPRDGASKYMLQLSDQLSASGHHVFPFAMDEGTLTLNTPYRQYFVPAYDLSEPQRYGRVQQLRIIRNMLYAPDAKRQIGRLLADHTVDIAHLHNIYHHISPSILKPLSDAGIPIIMTLHDYKLIAPNYTLFHHGAVHEENADGWYLSNIWQRAHKDSVLQSTVVTAEMIVHHKIMRYYERYVDQFIAPSQYLIDVCVRHGWDAKRFVHVPNPVVVAPQYTYQDGGYVLYVGRLSEEKGVATLLDAAAQLPDIPFYIVGDGPLRAFIEHRMSSEQLTNVTCHGFLSGTALSTMIAEASVSVVPSVWYENNPLSLLESCALGTVVIGSRIGGIPEMLPKELLFAPGDATALAAMLSHWMQAGPAARQTMADTLRTRVQTVNDPTVHTDRILSLYTNLIST